jgi:hypothetical protein
LIFYGGNLPVNILKRLFLFLAVAALFAVPGLSQTAFTTTTTSETLNATETDVTVASASGIAVGDIMYIDKEAMSVVSISGTIIQVRRGQAGSGSDDHVSGATVYHEVPGSFISSDLVGTCTAGSEYPNFTPLINPRTGNMFTCTNSEWALIETSPLSILPLIETTTAADTLTAEECGKTIFLNNATGYATTLPAPSEGCSFRFIDATLLTSGNHTVVTNSSSNIIIGGCNELEVDTSSDGPIDTNGDTITFVGSVDSLGDIIEVVSDGTSWYVTFCQSGLDGGFTITGS